MNFFINLNCYFLFIIASDTEFFKRLEKEAKEEIIKTKEKDLLKSRLNTLDDDITSAQLKAEVEQRDQEILSLKDEVVKLKSELTQVKSRNKKLYQILGHGESKLFIIKNKTSCSLH